MASCPGHVRLGYDVGVIDVAYAALGFLIDPAVAPGDTTGTGVARTRERLQLLTPDPIPSKAR